MPLGSLLPHFSAAYHLYADDSQLQNSSVKIVESPKQVQLRNMSDLNK